jgi:hypothetical protein
LRLRGKISVSFILVPRTGIMRQFVEMKIQRRAKGLKLSR